MPKSSTVGEMPKNWERTMEYKTLFERARELAGELRDEENVAIIGSTESWASAWLDIDLELQDIELKITRHNPHASGELVSLPDLGKTHGLADALESFAFVRLIANLDKLGGDETKRSDINWAKIDFINAIDGFKDYVDLGDIVDAIEGYLDGSECEEYIRHAVERQTKEFERQDFWIDTNFNFDEAVRELMETVEDRQHDDEILTEYCKAEFAASDRPAP